jgi:chorismate mutase
MELKGIKDWGLNINDKLIVSGPCSAESEEQVVNTCKALAANNKVNMLRAGIWKPRTRPNSFEGIGSIGLEWLVQAKKETGLPISTEVANPEHIEECLKAGVDVIWLGARTTVNPFAVQAIADRLRGVDIPVMVKNPINPDVQLWRGAIERLYNSGINKIAAIHRGFSSFQETAYRNEPKWELAIELKTLVKDIEIICDPSHICGNRELIPMVSQKALDLAMDGLMIESHENPEVALSDAAQQLKPNDLISLIDDLHFRHEEIGNSLMADKLVDLRKDIDHMDNEVLETLSKRMKVAEQIGQFKKDNEVTVLQVNRWEEILANRLKMSGALGLSDDFIKDLLNLIHKESISKQRRILED